MEFINTLETLLDALPERKIYGSCEPEAEIHALTDDSRQAGAGILFVAVRGVAADGHRFIPSAIAAGTRVLVVEELPLEQPSDCVFVQVPDTRIALGLLASRFYGDPSECMTLVGVTGTNGKTTVATLLYEMARMRGIKAGLLSTVANYIDGQMVPATHTTPGPVELNKLLRSMVDAGCAFAAMEVSSHAAHQHRIAGLTFAGGIFTNLTRDHLDYHKTMAEYLKAKKSFFDSLPAEAFALVNADDRNGSVMVQNTAAAVSTYSVGGVATFCVRILEDRLDGMLLEIDGHEVETRFVGEFNAANLAAVYGAARLLGVPRDEALRHLSNLYPVAGRFQPVASGYGVTAIVDYAHTPDALINVLDTLNNYKLSTARGARVITVCGCGGDRDAGKRPIMAREAQRRSDVLILTSDNPRHERPEDILAQMQQGLSAESDCLTEVIVDRAEAIARAAQIAESGDVILIAGKGHEDYQIIGDTKIHFDDREKVAEAFKMYNPNR